MSSTSKKRYGEVVTAVQSTFDVLRLDLEAVLPARRAGLHLPPEKLGVERVGWARMLDPHLEE